MIVGGLSVRQPPSLIDHRSIEKNSGSESSWDSEPFSFSLAIPNTAVRIRHTDTPLRRMRMPVYSRSAILIVVIFLPLMTAGCDTTTVDSGAALPPTSVPVAATLAEGTWSDVEDAVAAQRGRVVVVDIWSTSCRPCVQELPGLADLQQRFSQQVACISFNVDYVGIKKKPPSYYRPRVEKALDQVGACYPTVMSTIQADTVFHDLEMPAIPTVYVFGIDGALARRFDASMLDP